MIRRRLRAGGLTLIELLLVMTVVALLAAMTLPSLGLARERARVARVHTELHGIEVALEVYSHDHEGRYPPVRVDCNADMREHWCPLPVELAQGNYLPKGPGGGLAAAMIDEFNRGVTYKYAAPGPCFQNGSRGGNYEIWVPEDFPRCETTEGRYWDDPQRAPVRWAVWSLGPQPKSAKSQNPYSPLSGQTWYRRGRDTGVLVRFADRNGASYKSP